MERLRGKDDRGLLLELYTERRSFLDGLDELLLLLDGLLVADVAAD